MKILKAFFDSQRIHFEKGGKFEKLYPFFESIESIFFASAQVTEVVPHVRDNLDVKRYMALVIFALLLICFSVSSTPDTSLNSLQGSRFPLSRLLSGGCGS